MINDNGDLIEIRNIATDNKAEVADRLMKYLMMVNNHYMFKVNGAKVNISFSPKKDAPDMESILVKIASNRGK